MGSKGNTNDMHARTLLLLTGLALLPQVPAQPPSRLPNFERRTPTVLAVENVGPSVVNIRSQDSVRRMGRNFSMFGRMEPQGKTEVDPETGRRYSDRSLGSGVIVHGTGIVITNEHVVAGAERIRVKLRDGRELTATVLNSNRDNDLAVLRLSGARGFPAAELGDSDALMTGEPTIALGNPFGLQNSVTSGILSAKNRSVRFRGREVFSDFLQTSAMINPGNSGGPLLDVNGRVIGINVAIDNRGPGIGYAIPINRVKDVMTTLLDPEITKQAWVGIEAGLFNGELVVANVGKESPAHTAGIRAGDRIVRIGASAVTTPFDFNVALQGFKPGTKIPLTFRRGRRETTAEIPFTPLPLESLVHAGQPATYVGMTVANLTNAAASRLHIPSHLIGPVVLGVEENSSCASIGIRKGDVIIEVGRVATPTVNRLAEALRYYRKRGSARIKVYREDEGEMQGTIAFKQ